MTTFSHQNTVRMYDTDAAGIIYFASQFRLAHDAFEALVAHEGFSFQKLFTDESFLFVIVHAEADYKSSLRLGDVVDITVSVSRLGETSFSMHYDLHTEGRYAGRVETVHVCISQKTREKCPLPDNYREALSKYVQS